MARTGRPLKLASLVDAPTPEQPARRLTVAAFICETMEQTGLRAELCARAAGLGRRTIEMWMADGAKAETKRNQGRSLTPNEQRLYDFLRSTRAAHAAWIAEMLEVHRSIAAGGLTMSKVIQEVDPTQQVAQADGTMGPKVLKRRSETSRTLPEAKALEWELERLARDEEGNRIFAPRVEVTGVDGGPVLTDDKDARADALARELEAFQRGAEAQREVDGEKAEP